MASLRLSALSLSGSLCIIGHERPHPQGYLFSYTGCSSCAHAHILDHR